jgi:hypothetical protein
MNDAVLKHTFDTLDTWEELSSVASSQNGKNLFWHDYLSQVYQSTEQHTIKTNLYIKPIHNDAFQHQRVNSIAQVHIG